jgi:metallopeptidase MepB
LKANGERHYPATALFCNFNKPTTDKPTLLRHSELITLFHETGHALHNMVAKTRYSLFHGTNVADDFGEAPSQLLEHWCWTPSVLKLIGRHYSYIDARHLEIWRTQYPGQVQPEEKLPDRTVESLIRTKHAHRSLATLQNLHLSIVDMTCYQPQTHEDILELNVAVTYNRLRRELIPIEDPGSLGLGDGWAHGYAGWKHPMDNYDAGYYGYLL